MYVVYGMFLMFKYWFCWKYRYNKYMLNFIDHLHIFFCEWLYRYGAPVHCFSLEPVMLLKGYCLPACNFFIPKIIVDFRTDLHKMKIKHRIIDEYAPKRCFSTKKLTIVTGS